VRAAVATSFNAISVDGDCSTNDTVVVLANGVAGNAPFAAASADGRRFQAALTALMEELADMVVADGEGATKRARITVVGARTADACARRAPQHRRVAAREDALFGGDPNWGRIACAAGMRRAARAERSASAIGGVPVLAAACRRRPACEAAARHAGDAFAITVDLATGGARHATLDASDLTPAPPTSGSNSGLLDLESRRLLGGAPAQNAAMSNGDAPFRLVAVSHEHASSSASPAS
jgi:glutamate N-acetyltransferase/amino-acid N-acetyltransferase